MKEENVIIVINALKKIMRIFLGPFLTVYFIKTSADSITSLSIYYIFSYILLGIGSLIVATIIKNKFKIGMFRLSVILNFIYIMSIIILREKIVDYLWLVSILYGISQSSYFFPYNIFVINKIKNKERTEYTVKSKVVESLIGILCPIILGSLITVTNYTATGFIILIISLAQIVLSFKLTPDENTNLTQCNFKKTWKKLKDNKQIKKLFSVELLIGMNVNDGALEILMTILIFSSFKTNMNVGIITSISTILTIIAVRLYGKIYKKRNDKNLIIVSSIIPVISLILLLFIKNNITLIIYNFCYVVFTALLTLTREIRLFNISDSYIVDKDNQVEFFAIREAILNIGRVFGYTILLFAGLFNNNLVLNIVTILLTLSILATGLNITKIKKFER